MSNKIKNIDWYDREKVQEFKNELDGKTYYLKIEDMPSMVFDRKIFNSLPLWLQEIVAEECYLEEWIENREDAFKEKMFEEQEDSKIEFDLDS